MRLRNSKRFVSPSNRIMSKTCSHLRSNVGIPVEIKVDRESEYSIDQLIDRISRLDWLVEPKEALRNANVKPISMGIAGSQGTGERGGWAVVLQGCDSTEPYIRLSDAVRSQDTHTGRIERNQMLLGATIKGLGGLPPHYPLNIYTDDKNVERMINDALNNKGKGKVNAQFIGILKNRLKGRKNIRVIHVDEWPKYAIVDEARALAKAQAYNENVEVLCQHCRIRRHPPGLRECNYCRYEKLKSLGIYPR